MIYGHIKGMMMKLLLSLALLVTGSGAAAAAPSLCGTDQLVAMRVSRLVPGGSIAGFEEAVRDHKAWYVSHGLKDDRFVTAATILPNRRPDRGPDRAAAATPAATFVTFHVYGGGGEPRHDAAWMAYVAKYKANATIASEARFCLPKGETIGAR